MHPVVATVRVASSLSSTVSVYSMILLKHIHSQVLPFLDSSLMSTEDRLSQDSASSWHSSDSGGDDRRVTIASKSNPSFPSSSSASNQIPDRLPSVTTPSFMAESGRAEFLPVTPTQNFLPETPTVTTPTFIPDISMEDDGDVLSQQFGEEGPDKSQLPPWLSSDNATAH